MADIFVSYVRSDQPIASEVARFLEQAGFSVWWDRHVHAGADFSAEIEHELAAAPVVVVLWSTASHDSKWVRDEAAYARDRNKLIPIQLDASEPPLGFRQVQTLNLHTSHNDEKARVFYELATAARHMITSHSVVPRAQVKQRPEAEHPVIAGVLSSPSFAVLTRQRWLWSTAVVVGLIAVTFAWLLNDKFWPSHKPAPEMPVAAPSSPAPTTALKTPTISEKSIAVLPFTDMSEKKDQEYLADGMAEEVLNLLAKVPDLLVPARTSSFYFKGRPTKIRDIARELGVAHVLEGSVRRSGDHLRVSAKLVRADTGYQLWSETYDRELRDVFEMQDDIANAVVQALQIKLAGGELSRQKGGTQNLEAYQLYLRARSAHLQNTPSSRDAADEYLDQAIKLDPSYGGGWALLALNAVAKTIIGAVDAAEGLERAQQLAEHALHLSPDLAEAQTSLGWVQMLNWDWAAAETELQHALSIDPTNPAALRAAAQLYSTLGRWDDAERQCRAALARDPLNPFTFERLGDVYYKSGRYAEAEAMYRKVLELAPGSLWFRSAIGAALLQQGKAEAALAMVQKDVDWSRPLLLPIMLQANGRQAEADEALKALIGRLADRSAYFVAMTYAHRGDHDLALQWLERAYQQKEANFKDIFGEPLFKNIADDPRFRALLLKMNLPLPQW